MLWLVLGSGLRLGFRVTNSNDAGILLRIAKMY